MPPKWSRLLENQFPSTDHPNPPRPRAKSNNQKPHFELTPVTTGSDPCFLYWVLKPVDFAQERSVAFLSSRLKKNLSSEQPWFAYLHQGLKDVRRNNLLLVSSPGTTCDRFLIRGSKRYNLPLFQIVYRPSYKDCFSELLTINTDSTIYIFPNNESVFRKDRFSADEFLLSYSRFANVIKAKPDSGTFQRVSSFIEKHPVESVSKIKVANSVHLIAEPLIRLARNEKLTQWQVQSRDKRTGTNSSEYSQSVARGNYRQMISLSEFTVCNPFLWHCTRANFDRWPDQTEEDFVDELLDGVAVQRTPLETLSRILQQQKILAGNRLIRSGTNVVCFTACTLAEISTMRKFRSHLGRWDFEPFGIGISQEVMRDRFNARQVIYGDDDVFDSLPASDQPFFQKACTHTKKGKLIDWSAEKEWRVIGDMELSDLEPEHYTVFVPTLEAGQKISQQSQSRVVIMDNLSN